MLKFYYNGIKDDGGKLQKCSYTSGKLLHNPEGTITIYGKHYEDFSAGVTSAFKVENGTDFQTDYFENDRIRVLPDHPLYAQVKAAVEAQEAHQKARRARPIDTYCHCGHGAPCMACAA
jgi:hypothetical protein